MFSVRLKVDTYSLYFYNENMEKKNITMDDLAVMVKKGFDGVDTRFNGVDLRFNKVDKRFDNIEGRFDKIERILVANHHQRIEKLESDMKELKEILAIK